MSKKTEDEDGTALGGVQYATLFRAVEDINGDGTLWQTCKISGGDLIDFIIAQTKLGDTFERQFLNLTTSDATPTGLTNNGSPPSPSNTIQVSPGGQLSSYLTEAYVSVINPANGDMASFQIIDTARCDGASNISMLSTEAGTPQVVNTIAQMLGLVGVSVALVADTTNVAYYVEVTGLAATDLIWSAWVLVKKLGV